MEKNLKTSPSLNPFEKYASKFDLWFETEEGRHIFSLEVACVKKLMEEKVGRWLEVGVGTGRFAKKLGITEGIDPSDKMRAIAEKRGIRTLNGKGESLPFPEKTFDGILMATTLCFLSDPLQAIKESYRVLKESGLFILGLIPAESIWGKEYSKKAKEGHPIYSTATFYSPNKALEYSREAGFHYKEAYSCLLSPPKKLSSEETILPGILPKAGYIALSFHK
ncbi:MAG: class I SAM-dependent methyltransferase [Candidatus Ratteibacteria bacterium]|jgi:ubiquinone/menaquinone biosynthesis C-methylase UbiE